MAQEQQAKRLSRQEAHDLGQIIKERTKVLEAHAEEQAAHCLADFERKLATIYAYDSDEVWKAATETAMIEVAKAQEKIDARCAKLHIPKDLSPRLVLSWEGRGQMRTAQRRSELRLVAKREVEAMKAAAKTKIMRQSLDLRTQVVSLGALTGDAKLFLESLAPVDDMMHAIDFAAIESKVLEQQKAGPRRLGFGGN